MPIYRQMYKEAKPSADFDELIKTGVTAVPDWFLEYYLPSKRIEEIIELHCKKHKLIKRDRYRVSKEVYIGMAPKGD